MIFTARVRRREGNVLTRLCPSIHQSVCPQGGYPYPIMLCNITQNAMGQTPRGVPSQVQLGGYPYPITLCNITQNSMGQTSRGGVPSQVQLGGYPARSGWGGTLLGGGVPCWGVPPRPGQVGYPPQAGYSSRQGTPQARSGRGGVPS